MTNKYKQPHNQISWPLVLLVVGLGLFAVFTWWDRQSPPSAASQPRLVAESKGLHAGELTTIDLFREALPSVVHINTTKVRQNQFTMNVETIPAGSGSGFIWDEQGHIITNYHVIENADRATVVFSDNSSYSARVINVAPKWDLAVLKITTRFKKLRPIPIGKSSDLQIGQNVYAIGNPFGLSESLSKGIVSGLGRQVEVKQGFLLTGLIQTDAAINPGNSGGPLLDSSGRLIGVNTAILSPSGASAGIGFAIPVDDVNQVIPRLINRQPIKRPALGVQLVPDQLAQRRWGIKGVMILNVVPGSPAERAGLQPTLREEQGKVRPGDIITAVDGENVTSTNELLGELWKHKPDDKVVLTIRRHGQEEPINVEIVLGQSE
ncbi:MAG: S1C family serine protease [Gemmataceae bacterium]